MKRNRTALCFVVWNQRQGCEHDLPSIDFSRFDEVFAVDGGSTDGTIAALERYGIPVYRQPRPSLNAAYWHAVESTSCESLVIFFPKGTLDPAIIEQMTERLLEGDELVVPTRVGKGARNEDDDRLLRPRKWGVQALAVVAALLWRREGRRLSDVLHGVKGFTRSAFLRMNPSRSGITIDLEMAIRSYRLRLRRSEFPVHEVRRAWNTTHFRLLPTGMRLAACLWRELWSDLPLESPDRKAVDVDAGVASS